MPSNNFIATFLLNIYRITYDKLFLLLIPFFTHFFNKKIVKVYIGRVIYLLTHMEQIHGCLTSIYPVILKKRMATIFIIVFN
jgi:hypothetical protein